jgi:hypothetical protein
LTLPEGGGTRTKGAQGGEVMKCATSFSKDFPILLHFVQRPPPCRGRRDEERA